MRRVATQMGLREADIQDVFRDIYEGRVAGREAELFDSVEQLRASSETTGIKHEAVTASRAERGRDELKPRKEHVADWEEEASRRIANDPYYAPLLADELAQSGRVPDQVEVIALQLDYRRKQNELKAQGERLVNAYKTNDPAAVKLREKGYKEAEENVAAMEEAIKPSLSNWGRAGVALQQMLREDYSFAALERKQRIANKGEPLDADTIAKIHEQAKEIADLQAKHDALAKENEALKAAQATKESEAQATAKETPKERQQRRESNPRARRIFKVKKENAEDLSALTDWLSALPEAEESRASVPEPPKDKFTASKRIPDERVAKAAKAIGQKILDKGMGFDEWSQDMLAALGPQGAKLRPFLKGVWEDIQREAQPKVREKAVGKAKAKLADFEPSADGTFDFVGLLEQGAKGTGLMRRLHKMTQDLYRSFHEEGMRDREEILNEIVPIMQEIIPEFDRKSVGDAFAGIGIFSEPSKAEVDVDLRHAKAVELEKAKRRQIEKDLRPPPTGPRRDAPDAEIRAEIKLTNEAKRQHPNAVAVNPERQLKGALQSIETRIDNAIEDLERDLGRGEKTVKTRTTPEWTPEMKKKQAWLDELRQFRDMAFGKDKPTKQFMTTELR